VKYKKGAPSTLWEARSFLWGKGEVCYLSIIVYLFSKKSYLCLVLFLARSGREGR